MRTIWLASYPKSGNTWMRMLIGALSVKENESVDINSLAESGGIASARRPFDFLTLIDSGLLTHDEIDALRPRIYETQAFGADNGKDEEHGAIPRFVKVHDAYTHLPNGEPLLAGAKGADGVILIVRDPRDVAPSLANHNGVDIDRAIAQLNNPSTVYCARPGRLESQLRHRLLDWSGHVQSWLDQPDLPVHLVRYEDLKAHPAATLTEVLTFAGRPASEAQIARAVVLVDFENLKAREVENGFSEASKHATSFFRRGESGAWRDELSPAQVRNVETVHAPMMRRLGYALSETNAALQCGETAA